MQRKIALAAKVMYLKNQSPKVRASCHLLCLILIDVNTINATQLSATLNDLFIIVNIQLQC